MSKMYENVKKRLLSLEEKKQNQITIKVDTKDGYRYKRGRLSSDEQVFIAQHAGSKSDEWIARELNRNPELVRRTREDMKLDEIPKEVENAENVDETQWKIRLQAREDWPTIQKQYTKEELKLFTSYWIKLMMQMPDLTATEELQVMKLLHVEMAMHRIQSQKRRILERIEKIQERLRKEDAKLPSDQDTEIINMLTEEEDALYSAEQYRTKEFSEQLKAHSDILKTLKATRDQRYAKIENSKFTFQDWLITHNEEKLRRKESHEMELMRIATDIEYKRLGQYHEYEDGMVDRPILSAETVFYEDEEEISNDDE